MRRVLIVEDELPIAELEKDYLELSDFDVTIETDGIEGEKKAMSGDYDILILDVMLPGKDGFEICRTFRKKYLTPVIMVSAKKEDGDKIHALGLGADDYMTKPFSSSELVARVKAHLGRYDALMDSGGKEKTEDRDVIIVRDLVIDRSARRVTICGEERAFTNKEFDLLYFFATHPNRVYSRQELFKKLWGFTEGDLATVTVHIRKIREKIELDASKQEYIETVYGSGYRFNGK